MALQTRRTVPVHRRLCRDLVFFFSFHKKQIPIKCKLVSQEHCTVRLNKLVIGVIASGSWRLLSRSRTACRSGVLSRSGYVYGEP